MMLHLKPEAVRMDLAEDFEPASVELQQRFQHLLPEGGVGFGWMSQDLHPSGDVSDDLSPSSAAEDSAAASNRFLLCSPSLISRYGGVM